MALRSDLGRVRGLGSAKDGTSHWWAQRVTAVALVPLSIWFVFSVVNLVGVDKDGFKVWLNGPGSFVLMALFLIALFYHMQLGLQVVIEDYVHNERNKVISLVLNKLLAVFLVVSSITALMRIAFGG
ncbi:MAG TPA: succinate dehydrogenase, hydrophobic membrane anchor protein [Rhodospirillales bacterium]|jgi:succinate dehydrogenase / fumarate reductase membrane anchor subunit|nr:succinate dehydrogenase, hydrophobic membrane anchor protein [Rhodospirillales bacterium]